MSLRDVVFIHKEDDWVEELPYALRSLQNIRYRKVWFVGHQPEWVTGVEHLHVPDLPKKWEDIQNKYLAFITYQGDMTEEVVAMYDDTYFLDDRYKDTDLPTFHWGTAQQAFSGGQDIRRLRREDPEKRELSPFRQSIVDAGRVCEANGVLQPLNYALHVPFVFRRPLVPVDWFHDSEFKVVQWKTMAGNTSGRESVDLGGDVKVNRRVSINQVMARKTGLLSTLNTNFRQSGCRGLLRKLFPDPSPYEYVD
jgi:hypothetical protein